MPSPGVPLSSNQATHLISVAQLPLFEASGETVLTDGEWGRIAYTPHWVADCVAEEWLSELRQAVAWKAERRFMYERTVDVPRLTAHFRLAPADPREEAPPAAVRHASERVAASTGVAFDSVGLNLYRDGRDSVAPHNDHLDEIAEGHPIALVSLGATRRMRIRTKALPRRTLSLDLEAGSLLVMSYATQLHYTHAIPKTAAAVGERISLAFRVRTARRPSHPNGSGRRYR